MTAKKYQLAVYRSKAMKKPFELIVDEDKSILIPPPSTDVILDVAEATTPREQLRLLAGDQYEPLMEVIGEESGSILKPLMTDLTEYFGLGETSASPA